MVSYALFLGILTLIIVSFGTSFGICVARRVLCSLFFLTASVQCIVKHWPRGCILNRVAFCRVHVGMCVKSLSDWACFCQWRLVPVMRFISRCGNDKFSDGEHDFRWHNEAHQLVKGVCFVACEGQLQVVLV